MATSTSTVNPAVLAKAAILRQLGVRPGDGLPSWARQNSTAVDLTTSPYWGPQEAGDGSGTLGNGDGSDYYGPLDQFAARFDPMAFGSRESYRGQMNIAGNPQAAMNWLAETGQEVREAGQGNTLVRWLQDSKGKVTAKPEFFDTSDTAFWTAAKLAASVVGGGVGGNLGSSVAGSLTSAGDTAVAGGKFSDVLKAALISAGTSYAGNAATAASGLTGAAGSAVGGAVGSGVATAAKGGNLQEILKSALIGAAPGAAGAALNNNQSVSPLVATLVRQLAGAAVGRAPSKEAGSIQLLLAALKGGGK